MNELNREKRSVLIVEDDLITGRLIKAILEVNNFDTIIVENGYEALDFLESRLPDVILLDIVLPGINGLALARRIKESERLKGIPIIFLTANNKDTIVKEVFDIGAFDFISKPFKNLELVARINSAIRYTREREMLLRKKQALESENMKIEEQKELLSRQNLKLKEIDEVKDNFIACMTHDFKTPLTSIRSISEMLIKNDYIDVERRRELFDIVLNQIDNLTEMVDNLMLSFKKITTISDIRKSRINIKELCYNIFLGYNVIARSKGLSFNFNYDSPILNINCDALKIKELLSNLIGNALKFTEKGGISLEVSSEGSRLLFVISDSGIGIDGSELDKIFDKFYRSHQVHSRVEGNGLGLYIARKIIKAHDGDISVSSRIGQGTEFNFFLPLE